MIRLCPCKITRGSRPSDVATIRSSSSCEVKSRSTTIPTATRKSASPSLGYHPYNLRTLAAAGPFVPCTVINLTRSPTVRLRNPVSTMPEKCTKISPPSSWPINPQPFWSTIPLDGSSLAFAHCLKISPSNLMPACDAQSASDFLHSLFRSSQLSLSKGTRVLRGVMVCGIVLQAHAAAPGKR